MAITTQLVGKLGGGAKVESQSIEFTSPSANGTYDIFTVPGDSSKTYNVFVVISALSTPTTTINSSNPNLVIGSLSQKFCQYHRFWGFNGTLPGGGAVKVIRNGTGSSYDPSLNATIYWWAT